jgi:hypothetical protein
MNDFLERHEFSIDGLICVTAITTPILVAALIAFHFSPPQQYLRCLDHGHAVELCQPLIQAKTGGEL